MSHPRYALPGNEELGVALERRRFGQQDRTWTNSEFGKLIGRAMAEEREDYILALYLARYGCFVDNPGEEVRKQLIPRKEELFSGYGIGIQMGVKSNGARGVRVINLL